MQVPDEVPILKAGPLKVNPPEVYWELWELWNYGICGLIEESWKCTDTTQDTKPEPIGKLGWKWVKVTITNEIMEE